ncbi:MAG: leucine-rich repeat domain-containing protein [Bacteroidaceae bacterium]|nr:leucine-rich repeat domain-containing protein [Bacteroidaceae bacterium]
MKHSILSIIMLSSLFIAAGAQKVTTFANNKFIEGMFQYEISKHDSLSVWVSALKADPMSIVIEAKREVRIPGKVNHNGMTYKVKGVDCDVFGPNNDISSIVVEDGVEYIGPYAFAMCMRLESVSIPASVKDIRKGVFLGCDNLREIVVDKKNKEYDSREKCNAIINCEDELVAGCSATSIPKGVKCITEEAFSSLNSLKNIVIPEGVEIIQPYAFANCRNVESVYIPSSVNEVYPKAFGGCDALRQIVVDKNNKTFDSRNGCNAVIDTKDSTLIVGCKATVIPSGVKEILAYAFMGCTQLTDIVIPEGVTAIGTYAFSGCTALQSVQLPQSLVELRDYCHFAGCTALESVVIPKNVKRIAFNSFQRCKSLQSIVVEEGNKVYDSRNQCNAIIETATGKLVAGCGVTVLPEGVTKLPDYSMYDVSLKKIHIPSTLTYIDSLAFLDNEDCVSITVDEGNPVYYSPDGCNAIIERATGKLVKGCCNTVIPENVKQIGAHAFLSAPKSMFLPEGIERIWESAFSGCKGLRMIVLPASLKTIGYNLFAGCEDLNTIGFRGSLDELPSGLCRNCSYLSSINIPLGVKKIGEEAFMGCTNLKSIVLPSTVKELGKDAFRNAPCEEEVIRLIK